MIRLIGYADEEKSDPIKFQNKRKSVPFVVKRPQADSQNSIEV